MRQVVISIDTTGTDPFFCDRILEIGGIELIDGKLSGEVFHQYVNPQKVIDGGSRENHFLSNAFLDDKPTFEDIAEDILNFIGSDDLILFDADKNLLFLEFELAPFSSNNENGLRNNVLDVREIARSRHPEQENDFDNLCRRYYIDTSQTELVGALHHAELLADLFLALSNETTKKITSDPSQYEDGNNLIRVTSFSEFDEAVDGISKTALCRGVSNQEYPLLPSLFRHADLDSIDTKESNLMWVFKTHAMAHLNRKPDSEIEWLTIAQHHGLPTRLLDWSLSPLVACFFAVQSRSKSDAAVYIYDIGKFKKEEDLSLLTLNDIVAFFPSHATKRVTAQSGMFTIHPTKKMKLESKSIKKIVIPSDKKPYFLEKLAKYGIHAGTVFPDLDGLSSYLKYQNNYN